MHPERPTARVLLLDRRRIELAAPIKSTGQHSVRVRLHPEVTATFGVSVIPSK